MTDKAYHVPPSNDKIVTTTMDDMVKLDEKIEERFDRLESLLGVISTNEQIKQCTGLVLHHYFSIMDDELLTLRTLYQSVIALHQQWVKERASLKIAPH